MSPRPAASPVSEALLLAAACALAGWLLRLAPPPGGPLHGPMVWLPSGLALGVLLTRGWRLWPGVWLGAFLADFPRLLEMQGPGQAAAMAALIATGAAVQALLGHALAFRAAGRGLALDTPATVLRFFLLCGLVAPLVGASVGVATLTLVAGHPADGALIEWLQWWSGDAMGVVLGAPVILALIALRRETWGGRRLRVVPPLLFAILVLNTGFATISRLEFAVGQAVLERDIALQVSAADRKARGADAAVPPGRSAPSGAVEDPHPGFRVGYVPAALIVGVPICLLVAGFVLVMSSRAVRTERLVSARTAELEAARAEAERSAQLLREAVGSIAQGFTIYDENDRLVLCNEAYKAFYEASRDLIVPGATFEQIVRRGAERGQYAEAVGRVDEWVAARVRQHQSADGRVIEQHLGDGRWLLIVEHRTPSGYIAGNRIDITAIKESQIALRKSEARANQIIENSPEPLLLVDADGLILQANGRAEAVFGYAPGELPGKPVEILVPDAAAVTHRKLRADYARAPSVKPMGSGREVAARRKDGSILQVEISLAPLDAGSANQIIVVIRDITERRQAAAVLADRSAQLNAFFQLSPDGLVSVGRDGRVIFANPAFLHMTGLLAGEVVGHPLDALEARLRGQGEDPLRWPGFEPCFAALKVGAGDTAARGERPRHLLALQRPREAVLELVGVNSDAASVSRVLYVRDVTHEIEVDRMKSEFLSHAAHELRTPMASIFGFTELLMEQDFDAATRKDLLATIHRQTAWLVDIINELLDLARIESRRGKDFHIEAVALAPLVEEVAAAIQADPARWPLAIECPVDLPPVRADAAKLRQALTNVIGNAIKYSPQGGAVDIRCAAQERDGRPSVAIHVADRGIGMTPGQAERVGERFYRADTSGNIPGTGLGMTIVKEIVGLHGGSLAVASSPGKGSTVSLWFPLVPAGADGQAASNREIPSKECIT